MYNQQAFEAGKKGGCGRGPWGRGKFGGPWGHGKFGGGWAGRFAGGFNQVPVNIEETDTDYFVSLYAAGLVKENIKLAVKDDVLTISYSGNESSEETGNTTNYTYQEYNSRSFERSFKLNDKVLTENITASYTDGILKVTLPKNPETNKPAQTISVA